MKRPKSKTPQPVSILKKSTNFTGRKKEIPLSSSPSRVQTLPVKKIFRPISPDIIVIYGFHAVVATLTAKKRQILDLYVTQNTLPRIIEIANARGIDPKIVEVKNLSAHLGEEAVHQGFLIEARPLPDADVADIETLTGVILVLDQITDPHNVGAIVRTACAYGVDALIVTQRHSPNFSGVLAKIASGGLEHLLIVNVTNLARALEDLHARGYLIVGLDSQGTELISEIKLSKPLALVFGSEDRGLRRLTRENCDAMARLHLPGPIQSLNVSNACAAVLSQINLRLDKSCPEAP
ncbi:hypothetical protein LBMAG20_03100 [Methylocystaceae bacterium]|nr:hypothetical protein LBMAG20_03100 [Methylocystaceae bacterium]